MEATQSVHPPINLLVWYAPHRRQDVKAQGHRFPTHAHATPAPSTTCVSSMCTGYPAVCSRLNRDSLYPWASARCKQRRCRCRNMWARYMQRH
jgi:hypothetical protein